MRALGIFFVFLPCLAIICFICFAAFRAQNHKVSKIFAYGCLSVGTAFATIPVGFILLWVASALFT